jgi:hypothetical protein
LTAKSNSQATETQSRRRRPPWAFARRFLLNDPKPKNEKSRRPEKSKRRQFFERRTGQGSSQTPNEKGH